MDSTEPETNGLVIPTIGGLKKAPARKEKKIVVDELVDGPVYGSTRRAHIRPSHTNRKRFNQDKLQKLAANIQEVGIIQPILIRPVTPTSDAPEPFEIVAGERRWRAACIAALDVVPTITRNLTDSQAREIQILENLQREDPHPMEEAEGFQELMLQAGYTADQLAAKLEVSRSYVYGRLKLCALALDLREEFLDGVVDPSTALLLARIPVPALQRKALTEITAPYQGTGQPMPYRAAAVHIQANYTMDLTRAKFKLTDAALLPLAGACTKCPKKTGNQPEIFKDIKSADVCTDPACYAEKRLAHEALVIAAASKGGIPVYAGEEGKVRAAANSHYTSSQYVNVDSPPWVFHRNAPATGNYGRATSFLDGGLLPEPAFYVRDTDDKLTPFYHREPIQKLLEDAGACETVEVHAARMAEVKAAAEKKEAAASTPAKLAEMARQREETEAAEKKEEQDEAYRIELYKRLRARGASGLSLASLREIAKLLLITYELPDQALVDVYAFDTSSTESIHAHIDQAGFPDVQLLLIDMLLGDCLATDGMAWFKKEERKAQEATMHAMARHEGIDPDAVRASMATADAEVGQQAASIEEPTAAKDSSLTPTMVWHQVRANPEVINHLHQLIVNEHPHLLGALEVAAQTVGYFYGIGGFAKRTAEEKASDAADSAANDDSHAIDEDMVEEATLTQAKTNIIPDTTVDAQLDTQSAAPAEINVAIEPPAATAVDQPEPETKKPAPRARKPKTTAKPDPWPWPKSPAAGTTTPTPDTEAAPQ